jgi:hypothetical protein
MTPQEFISKVRTLALLLLVQDDTGKLTFERAKRRAAQQLAAEGHKPTQRKRLTPSGDNDGGITQALRRRLLRMCGFGADNDDNSTPHKSAGRGVTDIAHSSGTSSRRRSMLPDVRTTSPAPAPTEPPPG